jgi:hypothetical protein
MLVQVSTAALILAALTSSRGLGLLSIAAFAAELYIGR